MSKSWQRLAYFTSLRRINKKMWICYRHRHTLGKFWRSAKVTCQFLVYVPNSFPVIPFRSLIVADSLQWMPKQWYDERISLWRNDRNNTLSITTCTFSLTQISFFLLFSDARVEIKALSKVLFSITFWNLGLEYTGIWKRNKFSLTR